jgi:hypothetical protein
MELALRAFGSLAAIYGAAYYITALVDPATFVDWFSLNEAERRGEKGWRFYLRFGVTLLGCGFFMYAAAYSIVQVIPSDWGSLNEDGDWESTRRGLQITFAGFVTLGVMSALEKSVKDAALGPLTQKELKAIREVIRFRQNDSLDREVNARTITELKQLEDETKSDFVRRACRDEIARLERSND